VQHPETSFKCEAEAKKNEIFQFRISKKFRAFGEFRGNTFIISHISDHQE